MASFALNNSKCTEGSEPPVVEQKDDVTNEGETVKSRFVSLSRDQEDAINEAKDTLRDAEQKAKLIQKLNPRWFEDYKCQSCGTNPRCFWVNCWEKREPSQEGVDSLSPIHVATYGSRHRKEMVALSTMQHNAHIIIVFETNNAIENVM